MHGGRVCTGATLQLLAINAFMVRIIDEIEEYTTAMHQTKSLGLPELPLGPKPSMFWVYALN